MNSANQPQHCSPLSESNASSVILRRDDVVKHRGMLALINGADHKNPVLPQDATVADLLAVRDALDACSIEYLLVRGEDNRPVLAINSALRAGVEHSLALGFRNEPFYARTVAKKKSTVLLADGALSTDPEALIIRLYRPRVEPRGGLYYGAAGAIQLEFWDYSDAHIFPPATNALTRTSIERRDFVPATLTRYGRSWPTIENMLAPHVFDINFEIDMVFSWVDGSSEDYQAARRELESGAVLGEGDDHESRFRQVDELKYALRSVHMFAPWIRRIFIATDSAAPAWLNDHPKITLVRSHEHFADPSVLPTHNSMAVESQLHHIEGLAEHFLYSNDDMFFARPLSPELFFTPGGISRFMLSPNRIGLGESAQERSGFENSARVNRRLLLDRFGAFTTRHLEHSAAPLRRSVLTQLNKEFEPEFAATAASTFRAANNISVTNSLYHYYALLTGRAVMHKDGRGIYVDTANMAGLTQLPHVLARRTADFLCLNDGSFGDAIPELRRKLVTDFLEDYFPFKAPWEK
ncbi:stealth conserved region 3 domain-containing protein [Arthrobacter psychrochitiniphilus]|nr:stealth conserved region 3 domain-containing protein [Arthrobacter psychrochitiniphilus]NYG19135.1 hypothetical protein [Arthrobacter psychrochitiniphilus]